MPSLFHTSCPSCGAEVEVHSATAVTVVCAYCHAMLICQEGVLSTSGRHSALLQDFTPLQLGASGTWQGALFTLVGRLQVQYDAGSWNEWYALFVDGSGGWLSEAADAFVFTRLESQPQIGRLPEFDDIKIGHSFFTYGPQKYAAADIREITRSRYAAEGELPLHIPEEQKVRVVDCRSGATFLTLDYSQNAKRPEVFIGEGVRLSDLALQNTRSAEQIRNRLGQLKGSPQSSKCPNCGATVQWIVGVASHVICAYCHSQLDFSQDEAAVVATNTMRAAQDEALTLKLGSKGRVMGVDWWVIGVMKQSEIEGNDASKAIQSMREPKILVPAGEPWFEYLLYSPQQGFLWLTEMAEQRWALAKTLDAWPPLSEPLVPTDGQARELPELYNYGGQVQYAAGAFYWQVAPKDTTYYVDFGHEQLKLSTALMRCEQSWSAISEVPAAAVAAWFKSANLFVTAMDIAAADKLARKAMQVEARHFSGGLKAQLHNQIPTNASAARTPLVWLLIYGLLNLPALLMDLSGDNVGSIIVVGIIMYTLLKLPLPKQQDE